MKKVFGVLLWVAAVGGLIAYLLSHAGDLKNIVRLSVVDLSSLAALLVFTQVLNGARLYFFVRRAGFQVKMAECFHLAAVNTMMNYLPLKGGTIAAAFYLKKRYGLTFTGFVHLTLANHWMLFTTVAMMAGLSVGIYYLLAGVFYATLFYFFSLMFFIALVGGWLLLSYVEKAIARLPRLEKTYRAVKGLRVVLKDKRLLIDLACVNLLYVIVMGLRFKIAFKIVSYNAPLLLSVITGGFKIVATLLSVMPAGLGIAELAAAGATEMMHSGVNIGIYGASVDRIVSVITLMVLSVFSVIYLLRDRMDKHVDKNS